MGPKPFVDHYEVLQLSPNAGAEAVEKVYRLLAKRYHPDNQTTGDAETFAAVLLAYQVLSDPASRASYDVKYDENRSTQWKIFDQGSASDSREQDRRIYHGILSVLYIARRRAPRSGGVGSVFLEKMLGCPSQHLEFPLWYLKQHGWIEIMDNGQLGITVTGVDKLEGEDLALRKDRLIAQHSMADADGPSVEVRFHEPHRLEGQVGSDASVRVA